MRIDPSRALAALDQARSSVMAPSWTVRKASSHTGETVPGAAGGKGASWGRVIHRMLEALMRDPDVSVEALGRNLLRDEGRPSSELGELVRWLETVRGTKLWNRAQRSPEVLVEVPFAVSRERVLTRAVADLVFREEDRWVIVDYKSDATAGRLDSLVSLYAPQIHAYRRLWEDQTGQRTAGYLLFLDGSHEIEVGEEAAPGQDVQSE